MNILFFIFLTIFPCICLPENNHACTYIYKGTLRQIEKMAADSIFFSSRKFSSTNSEIPPAAILPRFVSTFLFSYLYFSHGKYYHIYLYTRTLRTLALAFHPFERYHLFYSNKQPFRTPFSCLPNANKLFTLRPTLSNSFNLFAKVFSSKRWTEIIWISNASTFKLQSGNRF